MKKRGRVAVPPPVPSSFIRDVRIPSCGRDSSSTCPRGNFRSLRQVINSFWRWANFKSSDDFEDMVKIGGGEDGEIGPLSLLSMNLSLYKLLKSVSLRNKR